MFCFVIFLFLIPLQHLTYIHTRMWPGHLPVCHTSILHQGILGNLNQLEYEDYVLAAAYSNHIMLIPPIFTLESDSGDAVWSLDWVQVILWNFKSFKKRTWDMYVHQKRAKIFLNNWLTRLKIRGLNRFTYIVGNLYMP